MFLVRSAECWWMGVLRSGYGVGFLLVTGTLANFLWVSVCGVVILGWVLRSSPLNHLRRYAELEFYKKKVKE